MTEYGNVTEDDSGSSMATKVTEATVLCIIITVCVVGNVSLWIVVLRSKALRTITSMFILGLSAADLFVATVNMPFTVYSIIVGYWNFSSDACVVFGFFNMLSLVSSVLSLCNISINRYFMVVKPNKFKDIYTTRNAVLMICGVFSVSILLSSPPLFGWCEYKYISIQSFCFADWANHMSYAFFMIGCCFGIPLSVMTVCNILIFRMVRKSRRRVKMIVTNPSPSKTIEPKTHSETFDDSVETANNTRLTFTDVEAFSIHSSLKDDMEITDQMHQLQNLNESSDEPIFWEINDAYKAGSPNNNNASESDGSAQENDRPWSERTLLKVETTFRSSVDIRTVSTHWADSSMLSQRSKESTTLSLCSTDIKQTKQNSPSVTPNYLHPKWKGKENENTEPDGKTLTKSDTRISVDLRKELSVVETSGTSSVSNQSERRQKIKLPRSASMRRREEVRLATTLGIIVIIFILCWFPYCVSMVLSIFYKGYVPRGFHMFTLIIGYANSGCNPIIYGVMNKRFKIGYKRLFCFCRSDTLQLNSDSPSQH